MTTPFSDAEFTTHRQRHAIFLCGLFGGVSIGLSLPLAWWVVKLLWAAYF